MLITGIASILISTVAVLPLAHLYNSRCLHRSGPMLEVGDVYWQLKDSVARYELLLLRALRFEIYTTMPHSVSPQCPHVLGGWNIIKSLLTSLESLHHLLSSFSFSLPHSSYSISSTTCWPCLAGWTQLPGPGAESPLSPSPSYKTPSTPPSLSPYLHTSWLLLSSTWLFFAVDYPFLVSLPVHHCGGESVVCRFISQQQYILLETGGKWFPYHT